MTISMYKSSVPIFVQFLTGQSGCIDKAEAHIAAKQLDANYILSTRFFPDMYNYARQVQQASTHAARCCSALAGVPMPDMPNTETSFAQLKTRLGKTIDFCKGFKPAQIDGTEDKEIVIKRGEKETRYKGMQFLLGHALPNFYFHVTTTYNILRHNGIEIGKRDYLGNP